jgi:hypothetical protein
MPNKRTALLAIGLCMVLTACGGTKPAARSHLAPDSLHVVRLSYSFDPYPPFDHVATDESAVQGLYDMIESLPPFPPGTYACPVDRGLRYHLTFSRASTLVLSAFAAAQGCQGVGLGPQDIRQATEAFWSLLARTLGVTTVELLSPTRP